MFIHILRLYAFLFPAHFINHAGTTIGSNLSQDILQDKSFDKNKINLKFEYLYE